MKRIHWQAMVLLGVLVVPLWADLHLYTNMGEIWRTRDGHQWTRIANVGYTDGVAYTTQGNTFYLLTRHGIVLRSVDQGATWTAVASYPVSDAVALVHDTLAQYFFLLTASGDLYRGTTITGMSAVANLGGSDFVDLVRLRTSSAPYYGPLVAITRSGDVYTSTNHGTSWSRVANLGSFQVVALASDVDTLQALTAAGDLYRSTNQGASWTLWSTLSQMGAADLMVDGQGTLLVTMNTGAIAQFTGGNWQWRGHLAQVGVQTMAGVGTPTLVQEEDSLPSLQAWRLYPNPGPGLFWLTLPPHMTGPQRVQVWNLAGQRVWHQTLEGNPLPLDLRALPNGMYLLEVQGQRLRVIKQ